MRLTPIARALMIGALGDGLANGVVIVYGGTLPLVAGQTPAAAPVLTELRFTSFAVLDNGDIEAGPMRSGVGLLTGTPGWFQVRSASGRVVGDGECGSGPGQLSITPIPIIQGGRVDGKGFVMGWRA